jgi:hypothetical protein
LVTNNIPSDYLLTASDVFQPKDMPASRKIDIRGAKQEENS